MVQGFLTVEVPVSGRTTFYAIYGDVFAYLCAAWTIFMLIYVLVIGAMRGSQGA